MDKTQGEQVADSLDSIANFDDLFEPASPTADAALPVPARDESGKFKAGEKPDDTAPDADKATEKAPDAKAADAAEEDEDDYIELPGEGEGAQPTRLKVTDVVQGYQERLKVKAELEELAQRAATLPAEVEAKLAESTIARQKYQAGLEQLQKWMQPRWPDQKLMNPADPAFDPATFHAQFQAAQEVVNMQRSLAAEQERVAKETEEVNRTVQESRQRREWAEAVKVWPELKDQATRQELVSWLKTEGYSDQEIDRIDSRDLRVIKRAFAHDKSQVAKETAAKVVLAKPRVVRPQARGTQPSGRQAAATDALSRLGKSGSMDDAQAALEALLG